MSVLEEFRKESETICHLHNASRLMNWDQQIVMTKSPEAVEVRGRQQAALARLAHERLTSKAFGELLQRTSDELGEDDKSVDAHAVARWNRDRKRAVSVKPALVEELSLTEAAAFEAWRNARAASDFSIFEPLLTKTFDLKREQAKQIGYEEHPYDPMLDEFEPGMTTAEVKTLFDELRPHLAKGVKLLTESERSGELQNGPLDQDFCEKKQEVLALELARAIGYPEKNRLDEGTHPFCSANLTMVPLLSLVVFVASKT